MPDFLLELRSEEIPARMQAGARASLEKLFAEQMRAAGVAHGALTVWSTPRRLALIARDLPAATEPVRVETKGPRTSAPAQALDGFLRKTGLGREQLSERDGVWFAVAEQPGRATSDVLAEAIPAIVRAFAWPKSMRWGAASLAPDSVRWVRPLSGIVAILGEALVACEVGGVASGLVTLGHRFHHPGAIAVGGAHDYADSLRAGHVIVDHAEREALIRQGARDAAAGAGLALVEDEGLVIENAGLTEWPVPLLGRFSREFLEVPPEVIRLTARTNQKYFVCQDTSGALADAFVCTANVDAADGGAGIVAGNRKVLAARLADARFFWEQDRAKTLEQHAEGLKRITFHEKLGTVWDKAERVAKLARWLVEEGIISPPRDGEGDRSPQASGGGGSPAPQPRASPPSPSVTSPDGDAPPPRPGEGFARARLADLAGQAGRLCKADLVTAMVGEFPELQGVMGGHYARAEGLDSQVADAIRDHYKPVGQGDEVPTAPVTVAVSLADKMDTLGCFIGIDERPTGSRDPFAIRRAAAGIGRLVLIPDLRLSQKRTLGRVIAALPIWAPDTDAFAVFERLYGRNFMYNLILGGFEEEETKLEFLVGETVDFIIDRLKVQQREAGVRHDLIDAVFALGGEDDIVRLLARVRALQGFVGTEDGANLLAAYKRAANILRKEGYAAPSPLPFRGGDGGGGSPGQDERAGASPHPNPSPEGEGLVATATIPPPHTPEPAEAALAAALDAAAPQAADAVAGEDFAAAMAALASLRAPIDAFFDQVTVNDPDPAKREARLALLDRFRVAVHNVADFSKIEG